MRRRGRSVRDLDKSIDELDCPIIAAAEFAEIYGSVETFDSAAWDHGREEEEERWTSLPRGEH